MNSSKNNEKGITRRQFVKGSAADGAAGLAIGAGGAGLAMHGRAKPWLPEKWDYETDIVVSWLTGAKTTARKSRRAGF